MMERHGRRGYVVLVLLAVVAIGLPQFLRPYGIYLLTMWAVMSIAAIGLNLTLGYAGQISLAQAAFVGIGAYASALMTTHGWPFASAIFVAGALAFAVGWVLGYPALRVQSHYLAFVTLAFGTLAFLVFRNEEWLTGGIYGISRIPAPASVRTGRPGIRRSSTISASSPWPSCWRPWPRCSARPGAAPSSRCARIRPRAASLGVDTRAYTLLAFAIGAGLGGVAGAFYAPLVQFVDPASFSLTLSFNLLLMVVVGGDRLLLRPAYRRAGCRAAAGMAALHRRHLSDRLCRPV